MSSNNLSGAMPWGTTDYNLSHAPTARQPPHGGPPSPQPSEDEWLSQKSAQIGLGSVINPHYPIKQTLATVSMKQCTGKQEQHKIIMEPFTYMFSQPGKDIRSKIIAAFNVWLKVPPESLAVITDVVRDLHTASLLVDDLEDNSDLRRGVPTAHNIFGVAQTLNSANYVYFVALQKLMRLSNPELVKIWTEEMLNLHRGQGMDLFWRDTLTCPTEEDYMEMVCNKTGGLFRLAIRLMQAESATEMDCTPLVNTMGFIFQVLDDYKNLSDTAYSASKGFCEDLTEGKFSLPVIHSIRSDPDNLVLINILKQRTKDENVKRYALSQMERTGSLEYIRETLRDTTDKAVVLLEELEQGRESNPGLRAILNMLRVPAPVNGTNGTQDKPLPARPAPTSR